MFDLAEFDELNQRQNEGVEFDIFDVLRRPTGIRMTIAGPDSDVQQRARSEVYQRLVNAGVDNRSAEERQRDDIAIIAACVLDWSGITRDGEPVPFSPEEAVSLLTRYPDVRDQVDHFSTNRALFAAKPKEGAIDG